jgi:glycosyltransferase involved in cell wall biosynthesis
MTVAILMPVHNEGERARRTLESIRTRAADFGDVVVFLVDDGSQPAVSLCDIPMQDQTFRVVLARHAINLGQGAALETARQLALARGGFSACVTMDSDGQHEVAGALDAARAIIDGADVAFGNRFLGESNVPWSRKWLLQAARLMDWALSGMRLSDAHNGLRGFSTRALAHIVLRQNRMAHATEITLRVSRFTRWNVVEIPVSVHYSRDSLAKGQRAVGALTIVQDLLAQYLFGDVL